MLAPMECAHAELRKCMSGVRGIMRVFASLSALSEFLLGNVGILFSKDRSVRVNSAERVRLEIVCCVREAHYRLWYVL